MVEAGRNFVRVVAEAWKGEDGAKRGEREKVDVMYRWSRECQSRAA
jgi:hypothetical protein